MILGRSYQIDYFSGWRYLFSENYRDHVKQKWGKNLIHKSLCLAGSFIGMLLTTAAAILIIQLVWFLMTSVS